MGLTNDITKQEIRYGKMYSFLKMMSDKNKIDDIFEVKETLDKLIEFYAKPNVERYEICSNLMKMKESLNNV